jgi:hypothetical protein
MQRTIGLKKGICATEWRSKATAGSGQMGAPVRNSQDDQRRQDANGADNKTADRNSIASVLRVSKVLFNPIAHDHSSLTS